MTDLLTRMTAARPADSDLDRLWSPDDRARLLTRIPLDAPRPRRHLHRAGWGLAAAAATAAAFVVVPISLDTPSASAAVLHELALGAAGRSGPALSEGTWLHERTTSLQRNDSLTNDGAVLDNVRESWTRWDGRVLLVDHRPSQGWTTYDVIDGDRPITDVDAPAATGTPASYQDPTPQFAATLPDDADGLLAYLDGRVSGSTTHEEALFEALADLAASRMLPPRTLAATFEALAGVEGVGTTATTVAGQPAVEVSFRETSSSSLSVIVVDRATGQVLSTRDRSPSSDFTSTTTLSEIVPAVPDDVLASFRSHDEGVRYDASGAALED